MKKMYCLLPVLVFSCYSFSQPFIKIADSIRKYRSVPGMVYAVFADDRIIEMGATGIRTLKSKDSINIKDRFLIGTHTAAFTAYVAARLAEAGKISWSTTLMKTFPELNGRYMKLYQKVTLKQ